MSPDTNQIDNASTHKDHLNNSKDKEDFKSEDTRGSTNTVENNEPEPRKSDPRESDPREPTPPKGSEPRESEPRESKHRDSDPRGSHPREPTHPKGSGAPSKSTGLSALPNSIDYEYGEEKPAAKKPLTRPTPASDDYVDLSDSTLLPECGRKRRSSVFDSHKETAARFAKKVTKARSGSGNINEPETPAAGFVSAKISPKSSVELVHGDGPGEQQDSVAKPSASAAMPPPPPLNRALYSEQQPIVVKQRRARARHINIRDTPSDTDISEEGPRKPTTNRIPCRGLDNRSTTNGTQPILNCFSKSTPQSPRDSPRASPRASPRTVPKPNVTVRPVSSNVKSTQVPDPTLQNTLEQLQQLIQLHNLSNFVNAQPSNTALLSLVQQALGADEPYKALNTTIQSLVSQQQVQSQQIIKNLEELRNLTESHFNLIANNIARSGVSTEEIQVMCGFKGSKVLKGTKLTKGAGASASTAASTVSGSTVTANGVSKPNGVGETHTVNGVRGVSVGSPILTIDRPTPSRSIQSPEMEPSPYTQPQPRRLRSVALEHEHARNDLRVTKQRSITKQRQLEREDQLEREKHLERSLRNVEMERRRAARSNIRRDSRDLRDDPRDDPRVDRENRRNGSRDDRRDRRSSSARYPQEPQAVDNGYSGNIGGLRTTANSMYSALPQYPRAVSMYTTEVPNRFFTPATPESEDIAHANHSQPEDSFQANAPLRRVSVPRYTKRYRSMRFHYPFRPQTDNGYEGSDSYESDGGSGSEKCSPSAQDSPLVVSSPGIVKREMPRSPSREELHEESQVDSHVESRSHKESHEGSQGTHKGTHMGIHTCGAPPPVQPIFSREQENDDYDR